jgi:hypothetical protein
VLWHHVCSTTPRQVCLFYCSRTFNMNVSTGTSRGARPQCSERNCWHHACVQTEIL